MNYTIILSEQEIANQKLHVNTLKMAKHFFDVHGFLKIENLFPKEFIQTLASAYESKLCLDKKAMTLSNGTLASNGRYIIPIDFKPPFNDPKLYANKILMPLMEQLLGSHFILSSLGAFSALPGSTDQHLHADYFSLFEEDTNISSRLPPFAITFAVPLIDIDLINGPTQIWSGSHHSYPIEQSMTAYQKHFLHGPMGCCYFWDYRTFHAGGSNYSEEIRSLLYMSYTRRWFKDFSNPDFLHIEKEFYQTIPEEHLKLFAQYKNIL